MSNTYVLYNPLSGGGTGEDDARLLEVILPESVPIFDVTKITNCAAFFSAMEPDDCLIVAGGDGTLHRFVNDTAGIRTPRNILYFPTGTGIDFACDLGKTDYADPFPIKEYLRDLPTVEVNGKIRRFLNGVGFGVDAYCCEEMERLRGTADRQINCTAIAVKGLLTRFEPRNAVVTVDGQRFTYEKVWTAPTMYGSCCGGGMISVPEQHRDDPEQTLSVMLLHGAGRLRTLRAFPGIVRGNHVKHRELVAIHRGHEITVEFDRPTPLQIDGEIVPNVTGYTARSSRGSDKRGRPAADMCCLKIRKEKAP